MLKSIRSTPNGSGVVTRGGNNEIRGPNGVDSNAGTKGHANKGDGIDVTLVAAAGHAKYFVVSVGSPKSLLQ